MVNADDVFKSTLHRAINQTGLERYSIPLFFGTNYDVKLEVGFSLVYSPLFHIRELVDKPIPKC